MQGQLISGKYELRDEVGRGGMGTVWRALDRTLDRLVAIKLMAAKHIVSPSARDRFEREAKALAQLRSPHIVSVYDYGVDGTIPYIVMELLEGEDLEARLRRVDRLSPATLTELLVQIASALGAAAAASIVHRDLKPANVFLTRAGASESVKLLDFGVACIREPERGPATDPDADQPSPHKLVGTPAFMSPEQLRGHPPHPLNDLWSLTVICYRALTGRMPFHARQLGDLIVNICTDPFAPPCAIVPDLPPALDAFFGRALAKRPSLRYATVSEFVGAFVEACRAASTTKILVIDDEPDMVQLLGLRFRKQIAAGTYEMSFADNGATGLEALQREPDTDVVLADINMPVMDGLTLLTKVPEIAPFARVVMVSAYGDMANIRQAMNAGAFDFVVKPIDFGDLEATIEKTARVVREHRHMASSDEENRVLRKLTKASVAARLGRAGPAVALATQAVEATVVCLRPLCLDVDRAQPEALIRSLNAAFEVVIPEVERTGGEVDDYTSEGVLVIHAGAHHRRRALDMCSSLSRQFANLAAFAGPDSPYAHGLAGGVAAGQITLGCVGSQACGRLGHTAFGPAVSAARQLSNATRAAMVLVDVASVATDPSLAAMLEPLGAHTMRLPPQLEARVLVPSLTPGERSRRFDSTVDSSMTVVMLNTAGDSKVAFADEDDIASGWTLSEPLA